MVQLNNHGYLLIFYIVMGGLPHDNVCANLSLGKSTKFTLCEGE